MQMINRAGCLAGLIAIAGLPCVSARAANIDQFGSGSGGTQITPGGSTWSKGSAADAIGGFRDSRFTFVSGADQAGHDIAGVLKHDASPLSVLRSRLQFDGENSGDIDSPFPNGLGGVDLTDGGASDAILVDVFLTTCLQR